MARVDECPKSWNIEPTCFDVVPAVAMKHAEDICQQMEIPKTSIRVAMALMIPNVEDPTKILYGLRNPEFHTEYKNTWGLPSVGMHKEDFLKLDADPEAVQAVMQRLAHNKLNDVELAPDRFVGWTGRLRSPKVDSQFPEPYYLIMTDVVTKPIDPHSIPMSTQAYSNLFWLTPQEHAAIVTASPTKACGACSQLAFAAASNGKF